jgi:hypothetical protein
MSFKRVATLALSAAALTAGVLGTPSANADTPANTAFALSASGLLQIEPIPNVNNTRGFAQDSVVDFSTPNHTVRARILNAQAGKDHAQASVADLTVDLSPVKGLDLGALTLTATAVEAKCDQGTASSTLAGAHLGNHPLTIAAPANTKVTVPGLASIVLNKQTHHRDGTVTVTAISITLTGVQTLEIASATCHTTPHSDDPQPPTPTTKPTPTTPSTPGDGATENDDTIPGQAPRPNPVPGHLDVTG